MIARASRCPPRRSPPRASACDVGRADRIHLWASFGPGLTCALGQRLGHRSARGPAPSWHQVTVSSLPLGWGCGSDTRTALPNDVGSLTRFRAAELAGGRGGVGIAAAERDRSSRPRWPFRDEIARARRCDPALGDDRRRMAALPGSLAQRSRSGSWHRRRPWRRAPLSPGRPRRARALGRSGHPRRHGRDSRSRRGRERMPPARRTCDGACRSRLTTGPESAA